MKTLEAVVEKDGAVKLLSKVRFPARRRALLTVLDEEPRSVSDPSIREPVDAPVDDSQVLGLWADREESALEIARRIREANRKTENFCS